ncbi:hypothetical protein COOONC_03716 [Cooperia oncophora]
MHFGLLLSFTVFDRDLSGLDKMGNRRYARKAGDLLALLVWYTIESACLRFQCSWIVRSNPKKLKAEESLKKLNPKRPYWTFKVDRINSVTYKYRNNWLSYSAGDVHEEEERKCKHMKLFFFNCFFC